MHKRVAIEKNLNNVKQYFETHGYSVELFDDSQLPRASYLGNYDAIILSGGNENFLGIEDTESKVPVIDAKGMSAEEIYKRLNH